MDRAKLLEWAERVATFFAENYGLPPITGRVLGWLMICEEPEQSAGDIAGAIGASRASLTTTMRFLVGSSLVRRLTRSGGRTAYYRIDDDMWEVVTRRRIVSMISFSKLTEEGMKLVGTAGPRASRLKASHDFFLSMAELLGEVMEPGTDRSRPAKRGRPQAKRR